MARHCAVTADLSCHLSRQEADEARAERIDDLARAYAADPVTLAAAESCVAGTFDESHYTELTLALYELHHTDAADLLKREVLTRLYRLAKVEAAAMDAKLREMAEDAVDRENRRMEADAAEAREFARERAA